MTRQEFIEECCVALQVESGSLNEESSPDDVEMWDSMGWLSLIAMIDEKLGVTLDTDDLKNVKKLGDFIGMFEEQGLIT
ncbi:TPA: acyl carrier protein [bacterium]|nr:acyl carrier protein [bacterium]